MAQEIDNPSIVNHNLSSSNDNCNDDQSIGDNNPPQAMNSETFPNQDPVQLFCNGYSECASEAIRYLIEDEGLSPNDPFVMGLKEHLLLQETCYLIQCLNSNCNESRNESLPTYEEAIQWLNEQKNNSDSDYFSAPSSDTSATSSPSDDNNG